MRPPVLRSSLIGLLLLCLLSQRAQGQGDVSTTKESEAQIARGIALRRAGQDREALLAFQRAEALTPRSARVQVHLAGTHQALGDWLRADEYLRQALAQASDPFVQRHRDTLLLVQQTIAEHVGTLEVEGAPAGAELRLNGELQGALPLAEPLRVVAGSYVLELSHSGYFTARRPITVVGGKLTREALHLSADIAAEKTRAAESFTEPDSSRASALSWLPWALGGLGVAALGVGTAAWISRERHAERWNDDGRCQRPGLTREDVCSDERIASERAETVLAVSAISAGLFGAGAILSIAFGDRAAPAPQAAQVACGMKGVWVTCAARF